jgi:hypothetical protein
MEPKQPLPDDRLARVGRVLRPGAPEAQPAQQAPAGQAAGEAAGQAPERLVRPGRVLQPDAAPAQQPAQRANAVQLARLAQQLAGDNAVPPAPALGHPPVIKLDGVDVAELTRPQIEAISRTASVFFGSVGQIVQYLAADEPPRVFTSAQLAATVKEIDALQKALQAKQPAQGSPLCVKIARLIVDDISAQTEMTRLGERLCTSLGRPENVHMVSGIQARAANAFFDCYPGFDAKLVGTYKVPVKFAMHEAKKWGDGVFEDGIVKLAPLDTESAFTFVRLLFHEIGHATFERVLLLGKPFPLPLDTDRYDALLAECKGLEAGLAGPERPQDAEWVTASKRLAQLRVELEQADVPRVLQEMSSEARTAFVAWRTLRANHGRYLCGIDMGARRRPAERQDYQAGRFTEFCAETFMLAATGDLAVFLAGLAADAAVPDPVISAWAAVAPIVIRLRTAILGTPR